MDLPDIEVETIATFYLDDGRDVTLAMTKAEFEEAIQRLEEPGKLIIRLPDRIVVINTSRVLWAEWS